MKKSLVLSLALFCQAQLSATVTLNISAGNLRTLEGALMQQGGLVILAASTTDALFNAPSDTWFFTGDDLEIKRWSLTEAGALFHTTGPLDFASFANWDANDKLQLYWFPTLGFNAAAPGAGVSYGLYRTDSVLDNSDSGWVTPSDGNTVGLILQTQDAGGSVDNMQAWGSLTTVPEPATGGLVFAAACVASILALRQRSRNGQNSASHTLARH